MILHTNLRVIYVLSSYLPLYYIPHLPKRAIIYTRRKGPHNATILKLTMGIGIFAQFASPFLLGVPLLVLAVATPWLILPTTSRQLVDNRFRTLIDWFAASVTKHLLGPVGTKGHVWAALLVSIIIFIAAHNILGLLPYTFVPTCLLSFNLALAVPI